MDNPFFRVQTPAFESREVAIVALEGIRESIERSSVPIDSYIVPTGPLENAISLGLFSDRANALNVQRLLADQDIDVIVEQEGRSTSRYLVALKREYYDDFKEEIDTIVATFINGEVNKFSITSTSYITNAASETEENFVSINFSNHLYKLSQDNSLIKILNTPKPIVKKVSSLVSDIVSKSTSLFSEFESATPPRLMVNDETSNYALYKPLNPLEDKIEVANENFIQYLYYLSSMACNKLTFEPNYLFWTGFENQLNLSCRDIEEMVENSHQFVDLFSNYTFITNKDQNLLPTVYQITNQNEKPAKEYLIDIIKTYGK
jgi:hypothetical protein